MLQMAAFALCADACAQCGEACVLLGVLACSVPGPTGTLQAGKDLPSLTCNRCPVSCDSEFASCCLLQARFLQAVATRPALVDSLMIELLTCLWAAPVLLLH